MNARELIARHPELLTYGQFNRWCNAGIFGSTAISPGRGRPREFSEEDARVVVAVAAVSAVIEDWTVRRHGFLALVAKLARDGAPVIDIEPMPGIKLTLDLQRIS